MFSVPFKPLSVLQLEIKSWLVTGDSLSMELLKTEKGNATVALSCLRELQNTSASLHKTVRPPQCQCRAAFSFMFCHSTFGSKCRHWLLQSSVANLMQIQYKVHSIPHLWSFLLRLLLLVAHSYCDANPTDLLAFVCVCSERLCCCRCRAQVQTQTVTPG